MPVPRQYHSEALTLRKFSLGEADLIVTFYTRDNGKLRAVAKGARKNSSRLVGHLEPLTQVSLSLAHGKNLDVVTQAQVMSNFPPLKDNLESITKGLYLAELVDGFGSEDQPNPALYNLALDTLHAIAKDPDSDLPLRYFEFRLLTVSGLTPELYHCVECRRDVEPGAHRFSPNVGGVICLECNPEEARIRPLSIRALKVLRLFHRGSPAQARQLRMDAALAQELKTLLASAVSFWLEKEIRSNSLIEHLQRPPQTSV
jgi:DNA repair protein RecO (recombination protein O)